MDQYQSYISSEKAKQDKLIARASDTVKDLKEISIAIGTELRDQNKDLDQIKDSVADNQLSLTRSNRRVGSLSNGISMEKALCIIAGIMVLVTSVLLLLLIVVRT